MPKNGKLLGSSVLVGKVQQACDRNKGVTYVTSKLRILHVSLIYQLIYYFVDLNQLHHSR